MDAFELVKRFRLCASCKHLIFDQKFNLARSSIKYEFTCLAGQMNEYGPPEYPCYQFDSICNNGR